MLGLIKNLNWIR